MLRRLSGTVNESLSRFFPETRLILRTAHAARYMRISPLAQASGVVAGVALVGWLGFSALKLMETTVRATGAEAALSLTEAGLSSRLAAAEAEQERLAAELALANARADTALSRLTSQHASLSNAVATERELAVALQAHRGRLARLAGEHDETLKVCEATSNEVTSLEAKLLHYERENKALSSTLAALNSTLGDVATERDSASETTQVLTVRLDALSSEIKEGAERQARVFSQLEDAASLSLGSLEKVFERSGIQIDSILSAVRAEYDGEGGPFIPAEEINALGSDAADAGRLSALMTDLERVNLLRIAVERLPFARPVGAARFTSGFGYRRDPKNRRRAFHAGIDFAAPRGTPIYVTAPGKVIKAGRVRGYGKQIVVQHDFGYTTSYAHLNRIRVKVGQTVERGQRIGDMGTTGRSTGTHLHYEVRIGGKPVNPAKYIEAARNVL